jgi:hypothetical protein
MQMPTFTTRVNFNNTNQGANGGHRVGGLFADAAGDLSGTTVPGGANGDSTAFDIPSINGSDAGTPASFIGTDGAYPDLQCRDSFQPKPMLRLALAALGFVLLTASAVSAAPALTEFSLPNSNSNPNGITTGPDGALWFTEEGAFDQNGNPLGPSKIGRITTGGTITEFATPAAMHEPYPHHLGDRHWQRPSNEQPHRHCLQPE